MPKTTPCLWFDDEGEEAAAFYTSVFPNSRVTGTVPYTEAGPGEAGTTMLVKFELDGQDFQAINGGPLFTFSEAISFQIDCEDQDEVDYYWNALTADGGEETQCGWLRDKFGLSWQVVPTALAEIFASCDAQASQRVMQAMLGMTRIDIAALQAAKDAD
ncbi:MAG TPA: VOC family protein [Acidimicrobiales bacterium]|nr:VOC family protein [Acidimicrobiales bacterium]